MSNKPLVKIKYRQNQNQNVYRCKKTTGLGNAPYNYLWLNWGCHRGLNKPMKLLVTIFFLLNKYFIY